MRYLDPATLQKIGPLDLVARQVVEGVRVGMHRSPLRGFSTQFAQHRPYVPGDEPRRIDWRVLGRTNRYYVKLFDAETNFSALLLLDASASMDFAGPRGVTKLEYAKLMAASLAHLIVDQRDSVGLAVFDETVRACIEPRGTRGIVQHIAAELEKVTTRPRTDLPGVLDDFARRLPRRGFVILLSDLLDASPSPATSGGPPAGVSSSTPALLKALNHLRFRGHNVVVFHILDHAELEFDFRGAARFEGLEDEGQVVTDPRRIRGAYLRGLEKFLSDTRLACQRSDVDYFLVDTARPVDAVLSEYLIGRMRGLK